MVMNRPKKVILHCSATPDYPDASEKFDLFGADDIDVWHKKRGWSEIGYHFVVRRNGVIEEGRSLEKYGAHAKGQNADSLGVCWIGTHRPTVLQVKAFVTMYHFLKAKFGIDWREWWGHYECNVNKECPGFSMDVFREMLRLADRRV